MIKHRIFPFTLPVLMLTLLGCTSIGPPGFLGGSSRDRIRIAGSIAEGRYTFPRNRFSVPVPDLVRPGAVIEDRTTGRGGTVSFMDGFGRLVRIDFIDLQPEEMDIVAQRGVEPFLSAARVYAAKVLLDVLPRSELIHQEYVESNGVTADFYVLDVPEGATLIDPRTRRPYDAKRASLTFLQGATAYILTTQYVHLFEPAEEAATASIVSMLRAQLLALRENVTIGD